MRELKLSLHTPVSPPAVPVAPAGTASCCSKWIKVFICCYKAANKRVEVPEKGSSTARYPVVTQSLNNSEHDVLIFTECCKY